MGYRGVVGAQQPAGGLFGIGAPVDGHLRWHQWLARSMARAGRGTVVVIEGGTRVQRMHERQMSADQREQGRIDLVGHRASRHAHTLGIVFGESQALASLKLCMVRSE